MAVEGHKPAAIEYVIGRTHNIGVVEQKLTGFVRYDAVIGWLPTSPHTVGILTLKGEAGEILSRAVKHSSGTINFGEKVIVSTSAYRHKIYQTMPKAEFVVSEIEYFSKANLDRKKHAEQYLAVIQALSEGLNLSITWENPKKIDGDYIEGHFVIEKYSEDNADLLREARLKLGD